MGAEVVTPLWAAQFASVLRRLHRLANTLTTEGLLLEAAEVCEVIDTLSRGFDALHRDMQHAQRIAEKAH